MSSRSAIQRSNPTKRSDNRQRPQPIQRQALGGGSPNPAEMQKRLGNQGTQAWLAEQRIQPKLTIGQPGDKYEQEADRTADAVMRMTDPGPPGDEETKHQTKPQLSVLQRSNLSTATESHPIQRLCANCEEELGGQSEQKLQRKENNEQTPHVTQDVEANINALDGKGSPLPDSTRNYFEPRFGADFSQVRVHTDTQAAETAKSINAKAFTVGNNMVFGQGQFAPNSHEGQKLMGHELSHVLQQSNGGELSDHLSMLFDSGATIIHRNDDDTSTTDDPLDEVREILSNRWVGPLDEYRLEAIWNGFGARVFEVASANIELWNQCLDRGAELYDIDAVDAVKEDFRSDTRQIARNYLDLNEQYILAEMEAVGLAENICQVPTEEQKQRLAEIQEIATEVISAQQAQSELRSIEVGRNFRYVPQIDSEIELPAYFDPERQPDFPSSNPSISWSVAKEHYDNLSRVISGFANRYPAIYAVMQQGGDEAMATLAAGSPQEARIVISGAFGETLANIRATRPKIGDDLDDRDLTPIHEQLFSGTIRGSSGNDWSNSLYKGAVEEMLADHERVEFWISLGLGTLAAAAFVVVELATAGSATFFIAAGVGLGASGLLVGRSWEQYEDLAAAADTEVSDEMQLVTQGQASAAFVTALVDSAFAFIDIAGPVARIARGGAAAGRAVAREGGEAAGREAAEALPEAGGRASAEAGEAGTEAAVRAGTREAGEAGAEAATTAAARLRPEDAANWADVQRFIGARVDPSNVPNGYSVFNRGGKTFIRRNIGDDARFARLTVDENGLIQAGRSVSRRISRPGALAANLGSRPARHQAHHVVPDQVVRDHPLFEAARRRGRPPYNVDNAGNGAYLAETPADRVAGISDNLPTHSGSHATYNRLAADQADDVMGRLIQRYGSLNDVPPDVLTTAAHEVQRRMREQLSNWISNFGDVLR